MSISTNTSSLAIPNKPVLSVLSTNASFLLNSSPNLDIKIIGASPWPFQVKAYRTEIGGPLERINSTEVVFGNIGSTSAILSKISDQVCSIRSKVT